MATRNAAACKTSADASMSPDRRSLRERRVKSERRSGRGRRRMDALKPHDPQQVLNTREACDYLRVSRPTYLKLVECGRIRARKIGRGWKVLRAELDRFLMSD